MMNYECVKIVFLVKIVPSDLSKNRKKSIYHTKCQKMKLPYQELKLVQAKLKARRANLKIVRAKLHANFGLRVRRF